jgi:hypothetical protein
MDRECPNVGFAHRPSGLMDSLSLSRVSFPRMIQRTRRSGKVMP